MSEEPEILFERRGAAGLVTLNRPRALNAVTLGMVRALHRQLEDWRVDSAVTRIVVTGAGGRAFSAGGDIRQVYELGKAGRQEEALIYWREEYALNSIIRRYPKPYISLLDGIVMGGGVGVSIHGSHRVAGDRFLFAMPEVNIGFFPDIGATWFLPRMPGELGTYCALTGERLHADDALASTIATHRVASSRLTSLREGLCENGAVDDVLGGFSAKAIDPAIGGVMAHAHAIDDLFAGDTVEAILARVDAAAASTEEGMWAAATAKAIRSRSPTSVKIALAQIRRGRSLSFEECQRMEFRIVSRIVYGHDYYEGVRATIIDKDNTPKWNPASLDDVSAADVERYFAPIENELQLP
jgi:enoyl-CoA hydratase